MRSMRRATTSQQSVASLSSHNDRQCTRPHLDFQPARSKGLAQFPIQLEEERAVAHLFEPDFRKAAHCYRPVTGVCSTKHTRQHSGDDPQRHVLDDAQLEHLVISSCVWRQKKTAALTDAIAD